MLTDVMIDLETLDVSQTSVIVSIGAVAFNPRTGDIDKKGFYSMPQVQQQISMGRTIRADTLKWWLDQGPKVYQPLQYEDGIKPRFEEALKGLTKYIRSANNTYTKVWGNGSVFDISILDNAYKRPPYEFWNVRDLRTLYELSGKYPEELREGTYHNALDDAVHQAKGAIWAFNKIGKVN